MSWFFTGSLFKEVNENPVKTLVRSSKHRGPWLVVGGWLQKKRMEWRLPKN
jgi:hypothetical protein